MPVEDFLCLSGHTCQPGIFEYQYQFVLKDSSYISSYISQVSLAVLGLLLKKKK